MSGYRLPDHPRASAPLLRFRFNGRAYEGRQGDTLAVALLANGVTLVGRSFKYHRPRGIVGHGHAESNALVQLGEGARTVPNALATRVPLTEGLVARSVNCWPSVEFDIAAINGRLAPLLSAGFYYKTFIWPSWHLFEGLIRRAAGLGRAPTLPDPDRYAAQSRRCDVLVIGGGVAGLQAAQEAATSGASVILVEADIELGGIAGIDETVGGLDARSWIARAEARLAAARQVTILKRTTATGYYDHDLVTVLEEIDAPGLRQRLWKIRAGRVVLAGGAMERPLLFDGNDTPGVMLADSVRHYVERHGVAPGRRLLFAVAHDRAYDAAIAAWRAGLPIVGIVDPRAEPSEAAREAAALGIPLFAGHRIERAIGGKAVRAADIADIATGRRQRIDCDLIAMSGGWSPAMQLFTQAGGTLRFDPASGAFVPDRFPAKLEAVGDALGFTAPAVAPLHIPPPGHKAFVDLQTDVGVDDLRLATRENYRSVEHVKRYTVWGMGTDQGKLGAVNGVAVLAALQGLEPGALGTTKFRPPFSPIAFGALAGDKALGALFHPWKHLPAHDWHVAEGARFEDYGWLRPTHYPQGEETMDEAARREASAIRQGVGLLDSSSFGKIELKGPEAGHFLDLMSVGTPSTIPVGAIRYNLLCNELGALLDDGVVARLAEDHFLMTASSGHAERVLRWLDEWHQCEWPLDLVIQDATARWAVLTVAGPKARAVMERLDCDIAMSAEAFAHNQIRCGRIAGVETRIQRVSFTGEISYEIAVPADYGHSLADYLMERGRAEGIIPFGLEALDILRLEKGFIHVGSDTDSRTQPADIGWGKGVARKAGDFVGKRSLLHGSASAEGRAQLVGLEPVDPAAMLPIGSHIIGGHPAPSRGIVTSSAYSPVFGRGLSLALLDGGRAAIGSEVTVWSEGRSWPAKVTPAARFDSKGERLNG
jgi:sarcosine oxidase, subunit alpha